MEMNFYTEYMIGWVGLLSFTVAAAILFVTMQQLLRWVFPRAYSHQNYRDGMVIELHHDIAIVTGLSVFLIGATPMFSVLYDAPVTPFGFLLAIMVALSATLIIFALVRMVKCAGELAANR